MTAITRTLCAVLLAILFTAAPAQAQTDYFWNPTTGGDGPWDTTTTIWSLNAGGPVDQIWLNDGTARANFGDTAGTVTLNTGISAFGLNFTTTGYTITGDTLTLAGAGGPISVATGTTATINSILADSGAVGLTKTGTGTLVLGGINTYTGPTRVNAGTLSISADSGLGAAPGAATAGSIILNTGTLLATSTFTLNANRGMIVGTGVAGGAGAINVAANQILTYNGIITNNGGVGSVLDKHGTGTLILGGANTHTGGNRVNNGTVILTNLNAFGTGGQVSVIPTGTNDATLLINTTGSFIRLVVMGVPNDPNTGRVVYGSEVGLVGDVSLANANLPVRRHFTIQAGATRTLFGGRIHHDGTTLAPNMTISAPVAATTAARKVVLTNPATASDFGDIIIGDSFGPHAALQFGNGSASGQIAPDASVINFFKAADGGGGGSLLIFSAGSATGETIGALHSLEAGAGTVTTISGTTDPIYTLTLGGGNKSGTFSGSVAQGTTAGQLDLAIVKIGTGTQVFSGTNNTYSAGTTINAGTLLVNGQTGSNSGTGTGTVLVNNTGTFGGTGRASGAVTVATGGTIRGGDAAGVGTLTLGNGLTMAASANLGVRVTDASTPSGTPGGSTIGTLPNPTSNNFINITAGGLTADPATLQFLVDGTGTAFNPAQTYSYQIGTVVGVDLSGVNVTNQAQFTPVGFTDPFTFSLTGGSTGQVYLNIAPIPEPATVLGLAAGVLGVGGYIRRRVVRRA